MTTVPTVAQRVQRRRDKLRAAGLRPIQIWVPDTRAPGFAEECERQCRVVAAAVDRDLDTWLDAAKPGTRRRAGSAWSLRRGDIVTVALEGDHGKPRPALIVQSDQFTASTHVAVLLLTSFQVDAPLLRMAIAATAETGLAGPSSAMLDRITTAPRGKIGAVIGHLDDAMMLMVNRALAVFLGLA